MASDPGQKVHELHALLPVLGMLVLAASAGALHASPRLAVLCLLAAAPLALVAWRSVGRLAVPAVSAPVPLAPDQRALLDNALALEARLEYAPIALFRIDERRQCAPLNASARRLVAPGRATAPSELYQQLSTLPVEGRSMIGFDTERGIERALVSVSALTLHGNAQRLVALMPVESELEAESLNAWRQLVHVLTHEIMNSLTPVASLSRTAYELLDEVRAQLPQDASADLALALDAISRRSGSLVEFVGSYRSLSNLPPARPALLRVDAMFERIGTLVGPNWHARGAEIRLSVAPLMLELVADAGQLEQALINLIANAFDATAALGAEAQVTVTARHGRGGRLRIEVADNGPGVPEALIGHIFTPFFTTRKQGSGIGLAMVRQLVHANGGTVRYAKSLGSGARFVVTF
jgi:signal transduction histidine kinase